MIPVVTPAEMREIDAGAPEPVDTLIERAGAAVARVAFDVLGGSYGRRVVVVSGKGNNGADGRVAARRLAARGVRVTTIDASMAPSVLPPADLVIDAAYGTGFRGDYVAPDPGDAFVLAVDVPSGMDALTGAAADGSVRADATVTFAALKPGLLYDRGEHAGVVTVVDIGLDVSGATAHLVEPADVAAPSRPRDAHKYHASVAIVGGSPGMTGAPALCARAAFRAGAGYVRLAVPGGEPAGAAPTEAVSVDIARHGWGAGIGAIADRMKALALGPGLGRGEQVAADVNDAIANGALPTVIDGDGLHAIRGPVQHPAVVCTPHEGEYRALTGNPVGDDRLADVRALASTLGVTVLLKGSTTVIASPDGDARLVTTGGPSLATAGTGDVLTGVIAALMAGGLDPLDAAGIGACAHGIAARRAHRGDGLIASDLIDELPGILWPRG